jgi:hypothetical protein
MAHYKRRRPRIAGTRNPTSRGHWLNHYPRWWDIMHHTRPRRRDERRITWLVLTGDLDPDAATWPLGNSRPHIYYW